MLNIPFIDALYFSVLSIETIGTITIPFLLILVLSLLQDMEISYPIQPEHEYLHAFTSLVEY